MLNTPLSSILSVIYGEHILKLENVSMTTIVTDDIAKISNCLVFQGGKKLKNLC